MLPFPETPEVLVVAGAEPTMASLIEGLAGHGVHADLVRELAAAREVFVARGGHRLLVLAPDLAPATAAQVFASLTAVDPELPVVVFGDELLREQGGLRALRRVPYHPASRAAVGAVLKAWHGVR